MLAEMIQRLFERSLGDAEQAKARDGEWLSALWAEAEEMGLPLALLSEDQGGFGLSAAEQGEALRLLGNLAVPLPLPETMGANRLLAKAGLPLAEGPAGLARADHLTLEGGILKGRVERVAWGENLDCLALAVGDTLYRSRAELSPPPCVGDRVGSRCDCAAAALPAGRRLHPACAPDRRSARSCARHDAGTHRHPRPVRQAAAEEPGGSARAGQAGR
jgi:hypothetical protein